MELERIKVLVGNGLCFFGKEIFYCEIMGECFSVLIIVF